MHCSAIAFRCCTHARKCITLASELGGSETVLNRLVREFLYLLTVSKVHPVHSCATPCIFFVLMTIESKDIWFQVENSNCEMFLFKFSVKLSTVRLINFYVSSRRKIPLVRVRNSLVCLMLLCIYDCNRDPE